MLPEEGGPVEATTDGGASGQAAAAGPGPDLGRAAQPGGPKTAQPAKRSGGGLPHYSEAYDPRVELTVALVPALLREHPIVYAGEKGRKQAVYDAAEIVALAVAFWRGADRRLEMQSAKPVKRVVLKDGRVIEATDVALRLVDPTPDDPCSILEHGGKLTIVPYGEIERIVDLPV